MKKSILLMTVSLMAALALAGCSGRGEKGLLYKVSGNGLEKPSYIFGTHHIIPVSFLETITGLEEAFSSAEVVVGELLMSDMGAMQMALIPHMMMAEGVTYAQMLTEEDYDLLDRSLQESFGAGLVQYGMFHPVALEQMFTMKMMGEHFPDLDPAQTGIDQQFQLSGQEQGKQVIGLESVDDQIEALFYSQSIEEQAKSLVESLRHTDFTKQQLTELNNYYEAQDLGALYKLAFDNPKDPNPITEEFAYALNKKRNDRWLAQLPGLMSDKSLFVAVGALHLPGEEGLLNQLRGMGYTVEVVK